MYSHCKMHTRVGLGGACVYINFFLLIPCVTISIRVRISNVDSISSTASNDWVAVTLLLQSFMPVRCCSAHCIF